MSINKVQFQIGLSEPEFIDRFGTEEKCINYLEQLRWPNGFVCESCSGREYGVYYSGNRKIHQCRSCRKNHRVTSETLFHRTKIPLRKWFIAIRELSQSKNSLSALELHRHIAVNYKTAWLMKHKIMQLMYEADQQYKLKGLIELDDAYLGGKLEGGKRGRGSENKSPFVAAVECNQAKNPIYVKLTPVESFTRNEIKSWAKANIKKGSSIVSDGLDCFSVLNQFGDHSVLVTSKATKDEVEATFKWVNTILSNVKTSIAGTFHSLNFDKYGYRYLAELQFRINRRFDLRRMFFGLLNKAVKSCPKPRKNILTPLTG